MRVAALAVVLGILATPGRDAWSAIVDASEAARYVGSAVTIEGDVAAARTEPIGLVLELAPLGPTSVRAVLVPSLISSLPRAAERIYAGKRVRVTGLLQRFQGRPEMVLESAGQIEIVDVAGAPPPTTTTTTRPAPAAAPVAPAPPAPTPPAVSPPPAPPPPPPPVAAEPPPAEPAPKPLLAERLAAQACERARARWHEAATRAREASAALTRCLDAATFACHAQAAALAPVLADLEWAEQRVAESCD